MKDFIHEIGLPSAFTEKGIADRGIGKKAAETCNLTAGYCKKFSRKEVLTILEECW